MAVMTETRAGAAAALQIGNLEYVTVMVKNQDAARAFYTEALGFEVSDDTTYGSGMRWLTVRPVGAQTKLVLYTDPDMHAEEGDCCGSGGCGCCGTDFAWTGMVLSTPDIQAAFDGLRERGVRFLQAPEEKPWGVIDALFSDPDGNVFNLVQKLR
jgi:catechol 2,3-dioxygenase-like lactoylglutathione lyase family enzyme